MPSKEHIDLNISENLSEGKHKHIKVFCISNDGEREAYEELINDPQVTITDETAPTVDKMGRVLITVKWLQPKS